MARLTDGNLHALSATSSSPLTESDTSADFDNIQSHRNGIIALLKDLRRKGLNGKRCLAETDFYLDKNNVLQYRAADYSNTAQFWRDHCRLLAAKHSELCEQTPVLIDVTASEEENKREWQTMLYRDKMNRWLQPDLETSTKPRQKRLRDEQPPDDPSPKRQRLYHPKKAPTPPTRNASTVQTSRPMSASSCNSQQLPNDLPRMAKNITPTKPAKDHSSRKENPHKDVVTQRSRAIRKSERKSEPKPGLSKITKQRCSPRRNNKTATNVAGISSNCEPLAPYTTRSGRISKIPVRWQA